jgi:hypothetical protein
MKKDLITMLAKNAGKFTTGDGTTVEIIVSKQPKPAAKKSSARFEDCFERVKPMFYINGYNEISKPITLLNKPEQHNNVPTERNAKQLQAFAKLLVIMHDLNGNEFPLEYQDNAWFVNYNRKLDKLNCYRYVNLTDSPIYFRTQALARKAIKENEQIFRDFFGL